MKAGIKKFIMIYFQTIILLKSNHKQIQYQFKFQL